jgi:1-acyl-sn-glycerol-3-phosphate acyltransferase
MMLQKVFYIFVKIAVLFLLGLNVRRKDLLPSEGPAIIVANHNSHLDTMVLMALMPLSQLKRHQAGCRRRLFLFLALEGLGFRTRTRHHPGRTQRRGPDL